MEHQILRRKLLEEHKTFQSAKEEEECPRIQARIAVSKSKTRYDCAACTRPLGTGHYLSPGGGRRILG